ncbi:uncharacterized protein LOC119406565 isoform X2 [Rhipicephalus sanguineus]|uniref:uncharacterized protein LOC119406565 isoform X2 n=1 Tax=Rhipicephalus sanguineus TaxID=34632 RepID=UPI0020C3B798|nr:uncharacterized protein LOC119406565 isoform X2 [Rhipicephalus sanguineus]
MKNLTWLTLTNILFNYDVASKIGGYVEETTALTILQFDQVVADDTNAGVFLDHLARNRSVKKLCVNEHLVVARHGQALADAVRNHVTLQEIEAPWFVCNCSTVASVMSSRCPPQHIFGETGGCESSARMATLSQPKLCTTS